MATKKRRTETRPKTKKRTSKNVSLEGAPTDTPVPQPQPALGSPRLDAALDPSELTFRGPQAKEAAEELDPERAEARTREAGQSGSLQGLSDRADADGESVDELLEEGNAFEAEVVKAVEDASEVDERGLKPREVPEDDVPEEYRDIEP